MKWDLLLLAVTLSLLGAFAVRMSRNSAAEANSIAQELAPKIDVKEVVVRDALAEIYRDNRNRRIVVRSFPLALIAFLLLGHLIVNSRRFQETEISRRYPWLLGSRRSTVKRSESVVAEMRPQVLYGYEFVTWNLFLLGVTVGFAMVLAITGQAAFVTQSSSLADLLAPKLGVPEDQLREALADVLTPRSDRLSVERSAPLAILAIPMAARWLLDRSKSRVCQALA